MQFVWSYQIFRLLLDISILICRNQLWTDRSIDDITKSDAALFVYPTLCYMIYEMSDQGLRNAGIHAIHAHVVTIIGSPS